MKIVKLQAENIKKLKAIEICPDTNVVKISGANEQGKTTVLDSIWWALGGTKNIQDQPIRMGEKKGNVVLNLGDMVVTRKFTESGSTLEVRNPQGLKYPKPQDMLDKLIGKFSFDPLAFAKGDKKAQVDTLLGIVNISIDKAKLSELAGVAVVEGSNPLDTLNSVYKIVFDGRTVVNRDLSKAKASYESKVGAVETDAVSISELMAEKENLLAINRENEKQRKQKEANDYSISVQEKGISEIREEIEKLKAQLAKKEEEFTFATNSLASSKKEYEKFSAKVARIQDKDLTDINSRIANADETNRKAQAWDVFKTAKTDYEIAQKESNDYTSRLESIKAYKAELMKTAKFPIDGLDFNGGGVTYQGLPFDQASSAQKLQVSLAIAMALNPELRVIRIDDGSLLDKKHMAIIEEMAKENEFQVWMEVVDESGSVGIWIEDGAIKES